MTLVFKFAVGRPGSDVMRTAASNVGVPWDETAIIYRGDYVGYDEAPDDIDPTDLQDELERLVGVRPSVQS